MIVSTSRAEGGSTNIRSCRGSRTRASRAGFGSTSAKSSTALSVVRYRVDLAGLDLPEEGFVG